MILKQMAIKSADFDAIAARTAIMQRIRAAAAAADRDASEITLVAVSKQQKLDHVLAMMDAGVNVFGENRVQDGMICARALREHAASQKRALPQIRLIGALQSNKALDAVANFDAIESLDRRKLARAIAQASEKEGRCPELFVQVNIGEEPQKAGIAPAGLADFLRELDTVFHLRVSGLMAIPPAGLEAAPFFALLAKLAARHGLAGLSMGMSEDFELAIRFGATHIRVGSALFGPRLA